jgi:hypothetical protein
MFSGRDGAVLARGLARLVPALVDGYVATVRVVPQRNLGEDIDPSLAMICEEAGVELWTGQALEAVRWTAARHWILVMNVAHEIAPNWARAVQPASFPPQVLCTGASEAWLSQLAARVGKVRRGSPFLLRREVLISGPADPWAQRFSPRPSVVRVPA